jgi:membrane protein YqaA with SNARE-associated domain
MTKRIKESVVNTKQASGRLSRSRSVLSCFLNARLLLVSSDIIIAGHIKSGWDFARVVVTGAI